MSAEMEAFRCGLVVHGVICVQVLNTAGETIFKVSVLPRDHHLTAFIFVAINNKSEVWAGTIGGLLSTHLTTFACSMHANNFCANMLTCSVPQRRHCCHRLRKSGGRVRDGAAPRSRVVALLCAVAAAALMHQDEARQCVWALSLDSHLSCWHAVSHRMCAQASFALCVIYDSHANSGATRGVLTSNRTFISRLHCSRPRWPVRWLTHNCGRRVSFPLMTPGAPLAHRSWP